MCSLSGSVPPEMKGYLHPATMMMMMVMVMIMMLMAVGAVFVSGRADSRARRHLTGVWGAHSSSSADAGTISLIDQRGCTLSETHKYNKRWNEPLPTDAWNWTQGLNQKASVFFLFLSCSFLFHAGLISWSLIRLFISMSKPIKKGVLSCLIVRHNLPEFRLKTLS